MLPSNLLRARVSRGGAMRLLYASPDTTAEIVHGLIDIFRKCQGMKKGDLLEKLEEAESSGDIGKKTNDPILHGP